MGKRDKILIILLFGAFVVLVSRSLPIHFSDIKQPLHGLVLSLEMSHLSPEQPRLGVDVEVINAQPLVPLEPDVEIWTVMFKMSIHYYSRFAPA